jgi:hypothetical protein
MPNDYKCRGCDIGFSVGRFHYHGVGSGYVGAMLAVCTQCCGQHRVDFALEPLGCEFISFFDVVVEDVSPSARVKYLAFIRQRFKTSLADSKHFVDDNPKVIASGLFESAALQLRFEFTAAGADVSIRLARQEANPEYGITRTDRLWVRGPARKEVEVAIRGPRTGATGAFDLSLQACGLCSAEGCLVAGPDEVPTRCPRCGGAIVESGAWVT